ncbi:hypothetical protein PENSPDRAFT_652194 [Peniophora sp. CONT]|nr:hypothetical protein PENSPDRAFT_652194 [Peniophora sp. CONT]
MYPTFDIPSDSWRLQEEWLADSGNSGPIASLRATIERDLQLPGKCRDILQKVLNKPNYATLHKWASISWRRLLDEEKAPYTALWVQAKNLYMTAYPGRPLRYANKKQYSDAKRKDTVDLKKSRPKNKIVNTDGVAEVGSSVTHNTKSRKRHRGEDDAQPATKRARTIPAVDFPAHPQAPVLGNAGLSLGSESGAIQPVNKTSRKRRQDQGDAQQTKKKARVTSTACGISLPSASLPTPFTPVSYSRFDHAPAGYSPTVAYSANQNVIDHRFVQQYSDDSVPTNAQQDSARTSVLGSSRSITRNGFPTQPPFMYQSSELPMVDENSFCWEAGAIALVNKQSLAAQWDAISEEASMSNSAVIQPTSLDAHLPYLEPPLEHYAPEYSAPFPTLAILPHAPLDELPAVSSSTSPGHECANFGSRPTRDDQNYVECTYVTMNYCQPQSNVALDKPLVAPYIEPLLESGCMADDFNYVWNLLGCSGSGQGSTSYPG